MQGDYSITKGMKISALIDKAGGLGGDSYLKANLTRISDDGSKILIDINLQKALNGDPDNDIYRKQGCFTNLSQCFMV